MPLKDEVQTAFDSGDLDFSDFGPGDLDLDDSTLPRSRISQGRIRRNEIAGTLRERFSIPAKGVLGKDDVERPGSLKDLVALVQKAIDSGRPVQMVGAGRGLSSSTNPVGRTVLSSERLDHIFSGMGTDIKGLKLRPDANPDALVRLQGGVPVRAALTALANQNRAIPNHGSGDFQSVAGALSTGTHGSGARFPSIAGFVRALVVVRVKQTPTGPVPWVELIQRSGGPQQAPVFREPDGGSWRARTGNIEVHPVFDDDRFFAHIVGMGALGLVYSVTLRVIDMMRLREWRKPLLLHKALDRLEADNRDFRHVELVIDPYPRTSDATEPIQKWKSVRPGGPDDFEFEALRCQLILREDAKGAAKGGIRPASMDYGRLEVAARLIGASIQGVLRDPVAKGPKAGQTLIGCTSMDEGKYVDDLPEVLLLNLEYTGQGAEWAVPLDTLGEALKWILEEECWRPWAARRASSNPEPMEDWLEKHTPFFQGPSVRFVRGEGALLAGSHEKGRGGVAIDAWAHIELGFLGSPDVEDLLRPRKRHFGIRPEEEVTRPIVGALLENLRKADAQPASDGEPLVSAENLGQLTSEGWKRALRLFAAYERGRTKTLARIQEQILDLGGRPHQGMWHDLRWSQVAQAWPGSAEKWRACWLEVNPNGTFDNALTEQWGITR